MNQWILLKLLLYFCVHSRTSNHQIEGVDQISLINYCCRREIDGNVSSSSSSLISMNSLERGNSTIVLRNDPFVSERKESRPESNEKVESIHLPGIDSASSSKRRNRPEKIETVRIILEGDSGGIQKTTMVAAERSKQGKIRMYV